MPLSLPLAQLKSILIQTWRSWNAHNAPRIGAALAYYTVFSMAPILIIAIALAGVVFGEDAAHDQVSVQMSGLQGASGAAAVQDMLVNAHRSDSGVLAGAVGAVTLLLGATSCFAELQAALNLVWDAAPRPEMGILGFLWRRVVSFAMVLVIGFLLLVSLVISAALAGVESSLGGVASSSLVAEGTHAVLSIGATTALFALLYKVLPDVKIAWRDVIVGAVATSLFFALGKLAIGFYLGNSAFASAYGAAGSFVVMLVWIYYSAQLLLLGAEFTRAYADARGAASAPPPPRCASSPRALPDGPCASPTGTPPATPGRGPAADGAAPGGSA